ncbi:MAG: dynamin family protein [Saprospiraceae bacterium]
MIINQRTQVLRAKLEEFIKELHQLTQASGHDELATLVGDLRNRMGEPFMFVIVGEVKAGKSSFVNALLETDKEICAVAPQPMTDTIQQILYGEEEETIVVNPFLKKIMLPVDILKDIAIVDTPGTNSIIAQHQEITENFIPASDLVIFVFEAKNPYRQSAWDFFDFIHKDWHKKILFILQQKDLLSPEDLEVNRVGLFEHAQKKGMQAPQIFEASAKAEQEGKYDESGFSTIRDYIRTHVTGGRGAALKLQNNLQTASQLLERIRTDLDLRAKQYQADVAFRADIQDTLSNQERKSQNQANTLIENILNGYDKITRNVGKKLESSLSFPSLLRRSVMGIFNKQASIKDHLEDLSKELALNLNAELKNKLNDGVVDLADSIQQMAKLIDLKVKNSNAVVRSDSYLFEDISEKRSAVIKDLQDAFARFMSRTDSFTDEKLFPEDTSVSPSIAAGSGIAIVGLILAGVTQTAVFDITGGVLTGLGILFAGITAGIQRRSIVRGYREEIEKGRNRMDDALQTKLFSYIQTIRGRIDENFQELDQLLESENKQINKLEAGYEQLSNGMQTLVEEIGTPE